MDRHYWPLLVQSTDRLGFLIAMSRAHDWVLAGRLFAAYSSFASVAPTLP